MPPKACAPQRARPIRATISACAAVRRHGEELRRRLRDRAAPSRARPADLCGVRPDARCAPSTKPGSCRRTAPSTCRRAPRTRSACAAMSRCARSISRAMRAPRICPARRDRDGGVATAARTGPGADRRAAALRPGRTRRRDRVADRLGDRARAAPAAGHPDAARSAAAPRLRAACSPSRRTSARSRLVADRRRLGAHARAPVRERTAV